jgi:hypothetical protein
MLLILQVRGFDPGFVRSAISTILEILSACSSVRKARYFKGT